MKKRKRKAGGDRKRSRTWAYPVEFRLRIVKLFLEEGYSASLISEEFGISQRTVEVHRARVMEKLQARRVADLFRLRFELDGSAAPAAEKALS